MKKENITERHFYIGTNAKVHIRFNLERINNRYNITCYYIGNYGPEEIYREENDNISFDSFSVVSENLIKKIEKRAFHLYEIDNRGD